MAANIHQDAQVGNRYVDGIGDGIVAEEAGLLVCSPIIGLE